MSRQRILIVDDEPNLATFMSALLEINGYEPIVATNGKEGLKQARKVKPQLIILDIMLPELSGSSMYRQLKADDELKHIPVIVVSAVAKKTLSHSDLPLRYNYDGERATMWAAPWDPSLAEPEAYIEKPTRPDELLEAIQNIIE